MHLWNITPGHHFTGKSYTFSTFTVSLWLTYVPKPSLKNRDHSFTAYQVHPALVLGKTHLVVYETKKTFATQWISVFVVFNCAWSSCSASEWFLDYFNNYYGVKLISVMWMISYKVVNPLIILIIIMGWN